MARQAGVRSGWDTESGEGVAGDLKVGSRSELIGLESLRKSFVETIF